GVNEAQLATGDSSAPIFINDGTGWKLAGVAAAVDAYFNTSDSGDGFMAALFDCRGLYYTTKPPNAWTLVQSLSPVPSGFYGTRVSARASWIDSILPPNAAVSDADVPVLSPVQTGLLAMVFAAAGTKSLLRGARR